MSAGTFSVVDAARIEAEGERLAAALDFNAAVRERARDIRASRHVQRGEAFEGFEQFDDAVEASEDLLLRIRRLRSVARSACRLADELIDLLVVHGSPSVGAADVASSAVSDPIVGVASGASASPSGDAPGAFSGAVAS